MDDAPTTQPIAALRDLREQLGPEPAPTEVGGPATVTNPPSEALSASPATLVTQEVHIVRSPATGQVRWDSNVSEYDIYALLNFVLRHIEQRLFKGKVASPTGVLRNDG